MSMTLNLVDRLLTRGRHFQQLGRYHDALHVFGRLAGFGALPADVAEETQARLAEIYLLGNRPKKARRHLTAALAFQPDSARYHYLMAQAVEADPKGDLERALEHYRRSLALDPDQADCLSECGFLAVRLGESGDGLRDLRRAVEIAPNDPELLERLVKGCCLLLRRDEARAALRAAMFRHSRDHRFRRLWDDFQFNQLRQSQEAERLARQGDPAADAGPAILPFIRPDGDAAKIDATPAIIRCDGSETRRPPHSPRITRLPRRRHA
jgi:tetratricopeptide (TPR) repeat protein